MALIRCPECGKEFSDKAVACPNCGFPTNQIHNFNSSSQAPPNITGNGYAQYIHEKKQTQTTKQPFYQTTWFTILMLICCCFPIGLYTMWKYKKFNQPIRIIISAFFAVSFAISVMTGSFSDESITSSTQEIVEESQTLEPTATEPETTVPELSNRDAFIQALVANPDVTEEAAASAYDTITATLGFSEISDIDNISGTLFEANADTYHLKITVSDKLYMVICGDYNMYEDDAVQYTKQDLDDRSIGNNESAYYAIAKQIVSNSLKNPSDADFCSSSECQMGRNKEYVAVQGYVDATNSFGAQLRSKFVVEFKVIDLSVFSYEVVYINIDGQTSGEYVDIK